MHCYWVQENKDCIDCSGIRASELLYECIDCLNCYGSSNLQNSENCRDSHFLKNCIGCSNCFGSANLRNKQYYFFNKPLSKAVYAEKIKSLKLNEYSEREKHKKAVYDFFKTIPLRGSELKNNED